MEWQEREYERERENLGLEKKRGNLVLIAPPFSLLFNHNLSRLTATTRCDVQKFSLFQRLVCGRTIVVKRKLKPKALYVVPVKARFTV